MKDLAKVLRMVWVKMMVNPMRTAMEHSPPLADLNSGFYLYLSNSVVLKRSQAVTPRFTRLNAFSNMVQK
jgi:hypothetical protein